MRGEEVNRTRNQQVTRSLSMNQSPPPMTHRWAPAFWMKFSSVHVSPER